MQTNLSTCYDSYFGAEKSIFQQWRLNKIGKNCSQAIKCLN